MKKSILILRNTALFFLLFNFQLNGQEIRNSENKASLIKNEFERYKKTFLNRQAPSDPRYDANYYKLDINITAAPNPNYLTGSVLMKATSLTNGLSSISLDLMNSMIVDSVKSDGVSVPFTRYTHYFDITLDRTYNSGEALNILVYYRGTPGSSGFGSFAFSSHQGTPWVWSLSEPNGGKDWWPSKDHPSDKADSADILITCSTSYKVGSNGKLIQIIGNGNGTHTYHWKTRYPISTYLISVSLTNYSEFTNWWKYTPTDSMPVLNYVLPENLSSAQASLPKTVGMLEIFSKMFGRYPFVNEKYGHAQFGWGGAMEHQTMTSTGTFSEYTIAHELAHQWFGDLITCRTWGHLWLNEGFATYCESLYAEALYGKSSYWSNVLNDMNYAKSATGTLFLNDSSDVNYMFNYNRVYAKGATVLHMLRHVVGDSVFFHAMYNYATDPALKFATATTAELQNVFETTSGKDLDYFFNEWIFGQGYPAYSYWWRSKPAPGGAHQVTVGIQQNAGSNPSFFTMPIDIKLVSSGWDTTFTVFNDQIAQTFSVTVSHQPTSMLFDSAGWIMKSAVQITAPVDTSTGIKAAQLTLGALASPVVSRIRFAVGADSGLSSVNLQVNSQTVPTQKSGELYFGDYDILSTGNLSIAVTASDVNTFAVTLNRQYLVSLLNKTIQYNSYKILGKGTGYLLVNRPNSAAFPKNWIMLGPPVELITTGQADELRIEMNYAEALQTHPEIKNESQIGVYQFINGQWVYSGGQGRGGVVSVEVEPGHIAAVFYDPDRETVPDKFILKQNFPNPFNPSTTIEYEIPARSHVTIKVYNLLGQEVRTLVNGVKGIGRYEVQWDGKNSFREDVASGMYLYRLEAGKIHLTGKMLLIR